VQRILERWRKVVLLSAIQGALGIELAQRHDLHVGQFVASVERALAEGHRNGARGPRHSRDGARLRSATK